jgi:hypothetical protein
METYRTCVEATENIAAPMNAHLKLPHAQSSAARTLLSWFFFVATTIFVQIVIFFVCISVLNLLRRVYL